MSELPVPERIILAIDTSQKNEAERLAAIAKEAGARFVKLGLQLSSAQGWQYCSRLAYRHGLDWLADGKIVDIPNTVAGEGFRGKGGTIENIVNLPHPPFAITTYTTANMDALIRAQEVAGDVKMLGVTELTSTSDQECYETYGPFDQEELTDEELADFRRKTVMRRAQRAVHAGLAGVVTSSLEVGMITSDTETQGLFTLVPGTRSVGVSHGDQARVGTPAAAIQDGADLLVIGRQITGADNPAQAYEALVAEIGAAL
jgi:orotidine-5'-phosphate decarboxylase